MGRERHSRDLRRDEFLWKVAGRERQSSCEPKDLRGRGEVFS